MRPVVASRGLGLAQAALQLAVEYAESRRVGGEPLLGKQGVQWELARAAADIEAAELLVDRAARWVDQGRTGPESAGQLAIAKLHATECAVRVSALATQILGAAGSVAGHPAERMYRDARSLTVVEGTSEIQLGVIAAALAARRLWWRPASDPVDASVPGESSVGRK
jgi:alkylation response protein AidB-like acyl-CoA dehydrogenase